jgi:hypothetical protein
MSLPHKEKAFGGGTEDREVSRCWAGRALISADRFTCHASCAHHVCSVQIELIGRR